MQVETFECLELTTDEHGHTAPECDAESLALIEQLELDGQKQHNAPPAEKGPVAGRSPYRRMTKIELAVYKLICPQDTKLRDYADSPIPLRVLQVAAHAQGMFQELRVWSAESAVVKDPVLVGLKLAPGSTWQKNEYILARWGEVLEPLEELVSKAANVMREKKRKAAQMIVAQANSFLAALEFVPDDEIVTKSVPAAFDLELR